MAARLKSNRRGRFSGQGSTSRRQHVSTDALQPQIEIGTIAVDADITLRRLIVRNPRPEGVVLLLHGFPETVYAWKDIALVLGENCEVHAFDWPGFGLSSRPPVDRFSYAPRDYADVLRRYFDCAEVDRSKLVIYATDIGALPTLLLALEEPDIARALVVGDFAPFDRPAYMWKNLQSLKSKATADQVRAFMNANREEILANTFWRGLPDESRYEVSQEYRNDVARTWDHGEMTPVDAFSHYYASFTRDQDYFETNLSKLETSVRVIWGDRDSYIDKQMGVELAARVQASLKLLPGIGHYVHLQAPGEAIEEVRAALGGPFDDSRGAGGSGEPE